MRSKLVDKFQELSEASWQHKSYYYFCSNFFLSYRKTFWWVVKKKSTENYNGIPYITMLLNTCLWTFYGLRKPGGLLLVTINGIGDVLQIIFVTLFLIYAPKDKKVILMSLVYVHM